MKGAYPNAGTVQKTLDVIPWRVVRYLLHPLSVQVHTGSRLDYQLHENRGGAPVWSRPGPCRLQAHSGQPSVHRRNYQRFGRGSPVCHLRILRHLLCPVGSYYRIHRHAGFNGWLNLPVLPL
ncbi:hypothetical protein D3C75_866870 [compost metagenome]